MPPDNQHPIFALASEIVDRAAALDPIAATYYGVAGHDAEWPDLSPAGAAARLAFFRDSQAAIGALPTAQDQWERLAVESTRHYAAEAIEYHESGDWLIDLDSMASYAQDTVDVFEHMDKSTPAAWDAVCTRLETMGDVIAGYRARLQHGIDESKTVAKRQVLAVIDQRRVAASGASAYEVLTKELAESDFSTTFSDRLRTAIDGAKSVQGEFGVWLTDAYLPNAVDRDGVGRERYVRAARTFLGTEIDPVETYQWGWSQVAELRARMKEVADEILPGGTITDALEVLKTEPERAAANRQDFVDFMTARNQDALERLEGSHFDVPDEIRAFEVKLQAPGAPLGASYVGPNEDFTRKGAVWWSFGDSPGPFPLYDQVSTLYHEGFPGHHLQVGVQITRAEQLTRLHRVMIWYPGLGEGWALYAEKLVEELGFFEKPDYVFGYLAAQILRACRVVIDIGSHLELPIPDDQPFHPGEDWTFETAVEMLEDYATLDQNYAESEVTRYLGWPGQAISYKVGERAILDIRAQLEARDDFDLKTFHADLLGVGPVGLDLLRELLVG